LLDSCKGTSHLEKHAVIDWMMIRYKYSYCPSQQYMHKKPQKWDIKAWCLANSISTFVWNFEIYCRKSIVVEGVLTTRESTLAHNSMLNLLVGHERKGHIIKMDNYFISIELFNSLLERGIYTIYTIGTLCTNRVGIPFILKNTKSFAHSTQGILEWHMHDLKSMSFVVWNDKQLVLLFSMHTPPIQFLVEFHIVTIPWRKGAMREKIQTPPIHLEYCNPTHFAKIAMENTYAIRGDVWKDIMTVFIYQGKKMWVIS